MAERALERWLRPRNVFLALAALLVIAVLVAPPTPQTGPETLGLSTRVDGPTGAKGLHDVLGDLGFRVERRETRLRAPLDASAVYAVLLPVYEPGGRETAALLDAVRRGAGLVVVPLRGSDLADSLRIERGHWRMSPMHAAPESWFGDEGSDHAGYGVGADYRSADTSADTSSSFGRMSAYLRGEGTENARAFHFALRPTVRSDSDSTRVWPGDVDTLLYAQGSDAHPLVMTRRVGEGTVMLIADGEFLRNAVERRGDAAVLAVRLFERLDPERRRPIVFDEFDQGFGEHRDMLSTIWRGLSRAPAGRVVLQAALAALVLLLAVSVRPIAPVPPASIERRSPLEHVTALSRAYAAVGATRLAARRLVRGLRRRHPLGATGALDDDGYLSLLRARAADSAADTELLRRAIQQPLPAGEFVRVGAAIEHLERTLTT